MNARNLAFLAGALFLLLYSSRARAREAGPAGQIGMIALMWDELELTGNRRVLAERAFEAAVAAEVPPAGYTMQLYVESRYDPNARSPVGALGLAQFMDGTAVQYDVITMPSGDKSAYFAALAYARSTLSGDELRARIAALNAAMLASSRTTDHRRDPDASIAGGLRYMRALHTRYQEEANPWSMALAAYNWGPGNVDAWLAGRKSPPGETRRYVGRVAPYYGESPAWGELANA